jgi:hypothetical protein
VDPRVVRLHIRHERFKAHGAGDLRLAQPALGVVQLEGAHGGQHIRAVDGRQAITGL